MVTGQVNIAFELMPSIEFVLYGDKTVHIRLKSLIIIR